MARRGALVFRLRRSAEMIVLFLLSVAVTGWLHFNVGFGELEELVVVGGGGRCHGSVKGQ